MIEFPTCDSDEVRSSSILVRVYVSHHHENKGPPAFCIPILDVHGLHRIQSRSATTGVTIKTRLFIGLLVYLHDQTGYTTDVRGKTDARSVAK